MSQMGAAGFANERPAGVKVGHRDTGEEVGDGAHRSTDVSPGSPGSNFGSGAWSTRSERGLG